MVGTGARTELGAIAESIRGEAEIESPLQHRMKRFAHVIGVVVAIASVLAFAIGVALGESTSSMFMVAVALAVSAVPEGLPVVFTITLALAVRRMARRNAIVGRLPAVETLGSTTVIGSDKTGTLTENRMTVLEARAGGRSVPIDGAVSQAAPREPPHPDSALSAGWPLPLGAAQILWLNLVTNGLQDVALAFEPAEPGVLQTPPRPRTEGVMSRPCGNGPSSAGW